MIVTPAGAFKEHLEQQGLKADSYEVDDARYTEVSVQFAEQHKDESPEQLQERIEYFLIWERYGIPPDEKGQDFVNSRRVIEMSEMLRDAKKSELPQIVEILQNVQTWTKANADTQVNCNRVLSDHNEEQLALLKGDIRARVFRNEEWQTFSAKTIADATKLFKRSVIAIGLLLIALILATISAHAQVDVVQWKEAGTLKATYAAPFKVDFTSGCTLTKSSSTIQIACPGLSTYQAVVALWSSCTSGYLKFDGTCSTPGSGSPGGADTQLQYNDGTAFNGIAGAVYVKGSTLLKITAGTKFSLLDSADATKVMQFNLSGITAGNTRTVKSPDADSSTIRNGSSSGQVPIWDAGTSEFIPGDPLVQGLTAHDAVGTSTNPVAIGGYASAAAPSNVSADGDIVRRWCLLNGSCTVTITAAGALVGGDATNGLDVDVTRVSGNVATTVADGANVVLGAKADAKSTATDTTAITLMQVLKQISASVQAPPSQAVTNAGTFATQADVTKVAGTAVDVNSGTKSAGTLRVVIATDQPALTNKLLVTPDSVALPANQSVNVAQINGVTTLMGAGNTGTGSQRVTIATDQAALAGMGVGATGAAPPANANLTGALGSGATGGFLIGVPVGDTYKNINVSTATTTLLVTGVSGRQVRISAIHFITAAANNVALIEGTGATCGTGTAGMAGGTTAASGYNLAANGGMAHGSGLGTVMQTATTGDSVCIVTSAAVQLSGGLQYTIY